VIRKLPALTGAAAVLAFGAAAAPAADLANDAFRLQYDATGIRSLRRTGDPIDTDYIAPGGALGGLLVRFRTAPNGDWRELREPILEPAPPDSRTLRYALGARGPGLATRSAASAPAGAGGLRALNDGLVPSAAAPAGRPASPVPQFTWSGSRGQTQWVQYAFPLAEEVSRTEVFWVTPPQSWRLLYLDDRQWKPVSPRGAYGLAAGAFTAVEFEPVRTGAVRIEVTTAADATVALAEWRVGAPPAPVLSPDLAVTTTWSLGAEALDWTITLANQTDAPLEVGDLGVPLPFAERTPPRADIYTRKLIRHALIAGHGSWAYWQRANAVGPFLVVLPTGRTAFEYFDNGAGAGGPGTYTPYVHARAARAAAEAAGGNWRLPTTGLRLRPGASASYSLRFRWAQDVAAVREVLYQEGKIDTIVVPGMVVPRDLAALVSLRARDRIRAVEAEHPAQTRLQPLRPGGGAAAAYRIRFRRLGENLVTVRFADGRWATLEFFVTEPLETVIQKRAAFLARRQQHRDPGKWYVGAYGDWDQRNEVLRGPEDRDSLSTWLTDANDDAGNARPAFLASKNVFFPDQAEIQSLELYVSKYLWGGLQMTDEEKYPYGLYGIPNWKVNRESPDEGRNGRAHLWRIYDYPHIALLYYRMHQIARFYPARVKHLDAERYLERAYRTALAYWTVPQEIEGWSADSVGTMNEAFLPELIQALEDAGRTEWAGTLRGHWEGKVERFVNRTPNLYGSEFAFDSTGFESTGALARYAVTQAGAAGISPQAALAFRDLQLRLNLADRGWLETSYFQLGSDYRGSPGYLLSYMSPMGGWSILDHGLHFARDPTDYLRLGYASSLSAWALVNSGDAGSGHGYWFPSPRNDGAAGGGFVPEAMGRGWIGKAMPRGAWHYSAEEDVGYCAALRSHATVVARDPVFGELAYGGVLTRQDRGIAVIPRDGLRVRFHVIRDQQRLHLVLDHDGFARERPIRVSDDLSLVELTLENRTGPAHSTGLTVAGLPAGDYAVEVDGRPVATLQGSSREATVALPVGPGPTARVALRRGVTAARAASPRRPARSAPSG
jgi:uncharacterized protein DUF5695